MLRSIQNNIYYVLMTDLLAENKDNHKLQRIKHNLDRIDIHEFFEACKRHEVASIIYQSLLTYYQKSLPTYWKEEYESIKKQISFMLKKTVSLGGLLAQQGIPIVILKNGGLALQLMKDPALCPMGDIDALVRKDDFLKAHKVLLEQEFKFKFRSEFEAEDIEKAYLDGSAEYSYENECGQKIWFELAHRAIAGRWIRADKEPRTEELIERSKIIPNCHIRVLSPEDNLLQVAMHTAKHSYVREPGFRLHLDVDRIVSRCNIDWVIFLEKVQTMGSKTAVYFSLYLPKIIFDTKIPERVLDELRPKRSKETIILSMIEHAGIMEPVRAKFGKITFILFQLSLYDSIKDVWRVIFPSLKWLKNKYNYKNTFVTPYFMFLRLLDLLGIRSKWSSPRFNRTP